MKKGINIGFVVVAVGVNLLLIWTGLAQRWGFTAVLLFIGSIFTFDAIFSMPSANFAAAAVGGNLQETVAHTLTPATHIEVRTFIFVWLFWWAATQFLYAIGNVHSLTVTIIVSLPMLATSLLTSVAPQHKQLVTNLFPLTFLLVLLFPAKDWMPQYIVGIAAWVVGVLRVSLYFAAVFVADFAIRRHVLDENAVYEAIRTAESLRRKDIDEDPEDHERSLAAIRLFTSIAQYEAICASEQQRIRSIVALSAWILVVPRIVIPIFLAILTVLHMFLFFTRRHAFLQSQKAAIDSASTLELLKSHNEAAVKPTVPPAPAKDNNNNNKLLTDNTNIIDDENNNDNDDNTNDESSETATVSDNSEENRSTKQQPTTTFPPPPALTMMAAAAAAAAQQKPFVSRSSLMQQMSASMAQSRVRTNKITINEDK
jgi:hypothetical protein